MFNEGWMQIHPASWLHAEPTHWVSGLIGTELIGLSIGSVSKYSLDCWHVSR